MAVPSSGQLRLRADINQEVNGNDTDDNVSLGTLADDAGFDTPPDTMQEFYGYVSYEQPTISGTPSTSTVYDISMVVTSPNISNPSGGNIERGFYFGTSTNMTSNTWYGVGNSSATSGTFNRTFTGLSGSTTYRVWAGLRDTESPARFTAVYSSMRSQATLAAISYSTYNGAYEWIYAEGLNAQHTQGWWGATLDYDHPYYGWTTISSGQQNYYVSGSDQLSQGTWQSKYKYRSGVTVPSRGYLYSYMFNMSGGSSNGSSRWNAPNSISGANAYNKVTTSNSRSGDAQFWSSNISNTNVRTMYGTQYGQYTHNGTGVSSGSILSYFPV